MYGRCLPLGGSGEIPATLLPRSFLQRRHFPSCGWPPAAFPDGNLVWGILSNRTVTGLGLLPHNLGTTLGLCPSCLRRRHTDVVLQFCCMSSGAASLMPSETFVSLAEVTLAAVEYAEAQLRVVAIPSNSEHGRGTLNPKP